MMEDIFAQKGWICPKCGRVLAPSTMYCLWCCSDMKETITTTTTTPTTIPKWDTTPIKGSGMIDSNGTGRSYFVKTSSISRDSHEITKDEPQTSGVVWTEDATKNEPKSYTTWASTDEPQFDKDINVRSKYKQGTWLYGDGVYCSCCGYKLETTALLAKCPKCGADMSKTDCAWK